MGHMVISAFPEPRQKQIVFLLINFTIIEFALSCFDYLGKQTFFYEFMMIGEIFVYYFIESTHGFSEFGVEMIFDTVVRPGLKLSDLPGSFCDITDHLLPYSSCIWKSRVSSSLVH